MIYIYMHDVNMQRIYIYTHVHAYVCIWVCSAAYSKVGKPSMTAQFSIAVSLLEGIPGTPNQ